jgi:hypothetical protein
LQESLADLFGRAGVLFNEVLKRLEVKLGVGASVREAVRRSKSFDYGKVQRSSRRCGVVFHARARSWRLGLRLGSGALRSIRLGSDLIHRALGRLFQLLRRGCRRSRCRLERGKTGVLGRYCRAGVSVRVDWRSTYFELPFEQICVVVTTGFLAFRYSVGLPLSPWQRRQGAGFRQRFVGPRVGG